VAEDFILKDIVQIAGITDKKEAQMLAECGVDYLGFPLRLHINKEDLSESDATEIIKSMKPPIKSVLITYLNNPEEIIALCNFLNVSIVQLHGEISVNDISQLKSIAPDLHLIKSLIVRDNNISELKTIVYDFSPYIDAFITDTYDLATGACGATGKTHDWSISRKIVELSPLPVTLAGGLNPYNVRKAIQEVRPAGVDSHTGVEDKNGRKSRKLVKEFVSEARDAFVKIFSI